MTFLDALILGVVEGLTEFLPVSSTGHLILTNWILGLDGKAVDAYTIVIQLGAILSVLALYRNRAGQMIRGIAGRDEFGRGLFLKLCLAFMPAAAVGLILEDAIDAWLFNPIPVAMALIVGGIVMICVELFYVRKREKAALEGGTALKGVEDIGWFDAFLVGCAQCFALWPGTSRSMCTILGGQLRGFSSVAAAEISFLLALPTLGAATIYKLIKEREAFLAMEGGIPLIIFGNVVAFIVAFFAVRWFVGIVTRYGMAPFGAYRIVVGLIFLSLALAGRITF
ncbi:MAG: undecaprenyl-diphosphate phosphatase [Candidatus Sumerlaeia bacterium]|nr:undecaprenyl-diphosphate phosphatase [Candidatus Sumerlaeia bacterium]